MLAKRLTQRGVALSGALAAFPERRVGCPGLGGVFHDQGRKPCAAGQAAVSVKVAALTEGVLKAMLLSKLKSVMAGAGLAAMVGVIGFGMARGQQKGDAGHRSRRASRRPEDAVVKEKAEKKDAIAWGKEVDGLQVGLVADASTCRQGEKLKLTVKLRNVGKAEVRSRTACSGKRAPRSPLTPAGGSVSTCRRPSTTTRSRSNGPSSPARRSPCTTPRSRWSRKAGQRCSGRCGSRLPRSVSRRGSTRSRIGGMIQSHPKLATGTVEFEVKAAESVTAWGKEIGGLQAGLGIGEKRAYSHGETVKLVVRVRNVGKEGGEVQVHQTVPGREPAYRDRCRWQDDPPGEDPVEGLRHVPVEVNLEPGKEIVLETRIHGASGVRYELRPANGSGEAPRGSSLSISGQGKVQHPV